MNTDQRPTPTPETDALDENREEVYSSYFLMLNNSRKLECERDEARATCGELVTDSDAVTLAQTVVRFTRERDEAREELAKIEQKVSMQLGGHTDSKLWGEAGLIAATMRCVDALNEVTEQRDEWKAKFIQQNKDLGCEMMDPNGTIWDHAKKLQAKLTAVTKQRDRLAESLERALNATVL